MKKLVLLAPMVALIAACSGSGTTALKAGQWEMTTKVSNVEAPGAPPAVAEQMKAAMASAPQVQQQCLTEADVTNMASKLGSAGAGGSNCNFTKTTFAGGAIDIAGTCQAPTGNVNMTMTGTFTAETLTSTTSADVQAGPQQVKITATTEGRRTGDCPAK